MGRRSNTPLSAGKTYSLLRGRGQVVAHSFVTDEEKQRFTVWKGAKGRKQLQPSSQSWNVTARRELLDRGIFIEKESEKESYLELTQDHEFSSSSQAASVLLGRSASGPKKWQVADADDAPLRQFEKETRTWPQKTEADQWARRRRGQDILREHLMEHCRCCPLTGIPDPGLLRASHIRPWADCKSDADKLDPDNFLLLSALWDAGFDQGLVTFDDEGYPQFSPHLSQQAKAKLGWEGRPIPLTDRQKTNLAWHRENVFRGNVRSPWPMPRPAAGVSGVASGSPQATAAEVARRAGRFRMAAAAKSPLMVAPSMESM